MKVKTTAISEQRPSYKAPETITVDIAAEGILCFSTEQLEEDNFNPWA